MSFSGESNSFIIFLFAGAFIIIGIGIFGAKATEITVPVPGGGTLDFGADNTVFSG